MSEQSNSPTALFSRSRNNKIRPLSGGTTDSSPVEIRPNRVLRIQHINARPRDPKFDKEIQMQMQYKKQGITAMAGPLSMPKKRSAPDTPTASNAQGSATLPNSIDSNDSSCRQISASGTKAHFTSPSNVHVDVKNHDSRVTSGTSLAHGNATVEEEKPTMKQSNASDVNNQQVKNSDGGVNTSATQESEKTPNSDHIEPAPSQTISSTTPRHQKEQSEPNAPVASSSQTVFPTTPRHYQTETSPSVSFPNGSLTPRMPSTMLFFFHGVGGSSDVWHAQIRHFAKEGYEIIAPDLIGHGMSCTPKDAKAYHFNEIAADLEEIFDRYCKRRNIVIGHSYGCSFAAVLARRRSRRVQKLVLISGGSPTSLAPQPGIFSLPRCMLGCVRPCLNHGFQRSAFHKNSRPVVDKEEAFSIPTYVLQHTMNGQVWPDGDELYHQWLLCSTLLIYGAQDKLVTLEEEKHMEDIIFRSRLEVIPDASHMVMIETPDEVNRLLLNFFQEDSTLATKNSSPQPPAQAPPTPLDRSISRVSLRSSKSHKAMPSHLK